MLGVVGKLPLGRTGPYRLVAVLGEGGMGRVYRAQHVDTGVEVALKTVLSMSPERMLALRMEISALREVKHPGVVRIEDEGIEGGLPWYAMELLRGDTLAAYNRSIWHQTVGVTQSGVTRGSAAGLGELGRGPATAEESSEAPEELPRSVTTTPTAALRVYRSLCEPLAHIHGRGVVHRDLKPSNVFITEDGRVVVMDFGLFSYARGAVGREILDGGERAIGTIHYLSPERIEGRQGDARADLYSLGCMLYETLTGRPPFLGSARDVIAQHASATPIPISKLVDGVPGAVDALVLALLTKSPQQRIGHASEVAALLDGALGNHGSQIPSGAGVMLFRPELSGRLDVLAVLQERLQEATAGTGCLALLRGESGIGKTFVGSEFALRAAREGFRVVTGECDPASSSMAAGPLHPLRRLLQAIADHCQEADPVEQERILGGGAAYLAPFDSSMAAYAARVGVPAPETLPGPAAAERVLATLGEALREFAKTAPVLLVIDDLQWADHLSLDFLASLDRAFFVGLPLFILGTYRSDEAPDAVQALARSEVCTLISLQRLDEQAATTMIGNMLAVAAPDHLVRFLVKQSSGNPFFIAEYLRYLVTAEHLTRRRGHWELGGAGPDGRDYASVDVPSSLKELVLRRLHALSAKGQRVTRAAAILGWDFDVQTLSALADLGEDDLLASIREAQERDVLEANATARFRFVHDKLRETAYGSIPPRDAASLHARAAAALEARASQPGATIRQASDVARHHKLAGNLQRALDFYERAGEAAVATSAQKDAAPLLQEALEIAEVVGGVSALRRARWERELGAALHDSGEVAEGSRHLERALELLERPIPSHPAAMGRSMAANLVVQAGHRLLGERALRRHGADAQHLLEAARTYDRLQQAFYYAGNALPMLYACVRTLNLAEVAGPSPDLTVAYANAAAVAGVIPAPKLVDVYRALALGNIRAAPDPASETYFCMLSGVYLTGIGSWKEAGETLERGLAIAKRLNYARRVREITGALAILDFLSGQFAVGLARADALHVIAVQNDPQTQCWALLSRAQVLLAQGRREQVLKDVRAADALVAKLGRPERIWSLSLEAAGQARGGAFEAADETSRRALSEIRQAPPVNHYTIDAHSHCAEVRILLASRARTERRKRRVEFEGLANDAARALRRLVRVFPVAKPRSLLVDGLLHELHGHPRQAARCFRDSLKSAQQVEMPYDEARARLKTG